MAENFLFWNCAGGIKSKIDYLRDYIIGKNLSLISISESDVFEYDLNLVQIKGYECILANTKKNGKGRVVCYVQSNIPFSVVPINDDLLDIVAIDFKGLRVIGIYKPFKIPTNLNSTTFLSRLLETLTILTQTQKQLIIGGDFNVNLDHHSLELDLLEEWAITCGLHQLIDAGSITRSRIINSVDGIRIEASTIDHVYTSYSKTELNLTLTNSVSDHVHVTVSKSPRNSGAKKEKTMVRDWRFYDKENANKTLAKHMEQISDFGYDSLVTAYQGTLNEIAPLRVIRFREDQIISTKVAALQKRRDRFLKKYKKTGDSDYLDKAKSFTYTLKKAVKKESRRIFQCKARSTNPKHFWQALNEKLGKYKSSDIELEIDGIKISDKKELEGHFGRFFQSKVTKLSIDPVIPISLQKPLMPLTFEIDELTTAIKLMSNKKSFGIDEVPQNLFKDTIDSVKEPILNLINSFSRYGLPTDLKIARVIPLHKKGSKLDINNYRPISNLSIFSKVYEKCLLNRLNSELPNGEGDHQHGFRKGHSTETALLTIQSMISKILDEKRSGIIYSIDLSAAFDLLKPDKFVDLYKDKLSEGLLFAIADFLSNRQFCINSGDSSKLDLDRGCVQGSILGPKLFSLYVAELKTVVETPEIELVSYADDTYVIVSPIDQTTIKDLAEVTISKHIDYLRSIGMIVNEAKTEVMWIGNFKPEITHVSIGNTDVQLVAKMKALGIYLEGNLSWDAHGECVIAKSKKMLSAFRFLRKYLTESQFLKAASANYYGSVFYASSVWFHNLKQQQKAKLTSTHFRMLRVAKRDFKMNFKRTELTESCKRATPEQWTKFITATRVIKTVRLKEPKWLAAKLMKVYFEEPRKPGVGLFFDGSKRKKGRQSIENRLLFMRSINYPWNLTSTALSDDSLRVLMKRSFFPYFNSKSKAQI
jgi:exonuclease III